VGKLLWGRSPDTSQMSLSGWIGTDHISEGEIPGPGPCNTDKFRSVAATNLSARPNIFRSRERDEVVCRVVTTKHPCCCDLK